MTHEYSIIITTCADKESATAIAKLLVEKQLAACVQMFPIESVYAWEGKICQGDETVMFIKSKSALFDEIAKMIKAHHTYDVPEVVQIPITDGSPEYLRWIGEICRN